MGPHKSLKEWRGVLSLLTSCDPSECVYVVQDGGSWNLELGRRSVAAAVREFRGRSDQCLLDLVYGLV